MTRHDAPCSARALRLRPALPKDHATLAELWRRSVEATHHFLSSLAVDELYGAVLQDYLPAVEEIWLAEYCPEYGPEYAPRHNPKGSPQYAPEGGPQYAPKDSPQGDLKAGTKADLKGQSRPCPAGFMAYNGLQVEMLFVEPAYFGKGVGKALLQLAQQRAASKGLPLTLDVNEQNPDALAFYRHMGFTVTGRSPLDSAGRPYPLLHMEWQAR